MRITVNIKEEGHEAGIEVETKDGSLSEVARVVSLAVTAAFEYPVECVLATDQACFDKDGLVE